MCWLSKVGCIKGGAVHLFKSHSRSYISSSSLDSPSLLGSELFSMRFTSAALAFAASILTASAQERPNGSYHAVRYENGTEVYTSLEADIAPIIYSAEEIAAFKASKRRDMLSSSSLNGLSKRRTDCWGNMLDRPTVDGLLNGLRDWAGNGQQICVTDSRTQWFEIAFNGVLVYYCVNERNKCGTANRGDIDYAIFQMDNKCRPYEASWWGWPNTFEIVGKARSWDAVCAGNMNGIPW